MGERVVGGGHPEPGREGRVVALVEAVLDADDADVGVGDEVGEARGGAAGVGDDQADPADVEEGRGAALARGITAANYCYNNYYCYYCYLYCY